MEQQTNPTQTNQTAQVNQTAATDITPAQQQENSIESASATTSSTKNKGGVMAYVLFGCVFGGILVVLLMFTGCTSSIASSIIADEYGTSIHSSDEDSYSKEDNEKESKSEDSDDEKEDEYSLEDFGGNFSGFYDVH